MKDLIAARKIYQLTPMIDLKDGAPHEICIPMLKKLPRHENLGLVYGLKVLGKLELDKFDADLKERLFKGTGNFKSLTEMRDIFNGIGNLFKDPLNLDR